MFAPVETASRSMTGATWYVSPIENDAFLVKSIIGTARTVLVCDVYAITVKVEDDIRAESGRSLPE